MRRRWHTPKDFLPILGAVVGGVWLVGWIPGLLLVHELTDSTSEVGWQGQMFLGVWFGVALVLALGYGMAQAWRHRPRRRWEPVTRDAREVHRR